MKKQIIKLVLQLSLIVMLLHTLALTELNNNLLMSILVTTALLVLYDVGEEIGREK